MYMYEHVREERGHSFGDCRGFARFGRHGHHFRGGEFPGFGRGGRERMFDSGDLPLLILSLLAEKPSYGYELIKTLEEKLAGGYAPSPGAVYPTLTMLEEEGFTSATTNEAGKKVYAVTAEGHAHLETNARRLKEIGERLQAAGGAFRRGRNPQVMQAFMALGSAVREKVGARRMSAEEYKKIAEAIDAAARTIREM